MLAAAMMIAADLAATAAAAEAGAGGAMKTCATHYRDARAAGTLAAGETWLHFLATCRADLPRAGAAAAPGVAGNAPQTAAQAAAQARMKRCSAQWRDDKAAGRTAGRTWPAYWSACSARLKSGG